jgi:RecJ-like exonuclease
VLKSPVLCTKCNDNGLVSQMDWRERDTTDVYTRRCTKCNRYVNFRHDSFLDKVRISITRIIRIIFSWALEYPMVDVALTVANQLL